MKKGMFTKLSKALIALCMVFCLTVGYVGSVEAAGWTTLSVSSSKTMKCYTLANANEPTYTSSDLTTKKGTVYPTDEITIVKIGTYKDSSKTIDYALIHYPTSNGTKEAYIALNKLSKAGYGAFTEMRAKAKIENVYRRASSTRYGTSYISKGDVVYRSVTSGDYTQVIYPVTSGWKMAFIKTTDANKYLSVPGSSTGSGTTISNTTSLQWPVKDVYVCGNNWSEYYAKAGNDHLGVDISSNSGNRDVFAAGDGTVVQVGWNNANGNTITIKHTISGKTVYSFYGHLSSTNVTAETTVKKGQKIGVIGSTGSASTGPHLHFAFTTQNGAGTWGYGTPFTGYSTTYKGFSYYSPSYVITNGKLP